MDEVTQANSNNEGSSSQQIPERMDISKTTVTVLVLITLMISVIGTWTVLNEISSVRAVQQKESSTTGRISFTVGEPENLQKDPVAASGRVVLNFVK